MARVPKIHRILTCDRWESEFSGDTAINLSDDTVFQFLSEEYDGLSPPSSIDDDNADDGRERRCREDQDFWEIQNQLFQSTICRTSSLESRIRNITKEALKESGDVCVCGRPDDRACRQCLMAEVCRRLQNAGFDGAICKSKWTSSPDIPSGEHTFMDVIERSNPKKEVRVIIELNFRSQLEMRRADEEYNKLIKKVPEVFVGKLGRLSEVLKIVCRAAKKCMKEKKMHMPPWRRQCYMEAKWVRSCHRIAPSQTQTFLSEFHYSGRPPRPGKSLRTHHLHAPFLAVV